MTEINRDYEADEDTGDIGGPLDIWWWSGHGHPPDDLIIEALCDALAEEGRCPAVRGEARPAEVWQRGCPTGDGLVWERIHQSQFDRLDRREQGYWHPVTVLDLERRRSGLGRCSVNRCKSPATRRTPLRMVQNPDDPYTTLTFATCADHAETIPEPHYRCVVVPIGATVMLPVSDVDGDR